MSIFFQLLTIAAMGALLIWAAVPAGLAMGLHPALAGAAAAAGSIFVVLVVVVLGEPARAWLLRRVGPRLEQALRSSSRAPDGAAPHSPDPEGAGQTSARRSLIVAVWERYGFVGLALVAPLFPGPAAVAALALALGISGRRVFLWVSIGIILWTAAFTLAVTLGFRGFRQVAG